MVKYRTLDNIEENYLRDHPEELDDYVVEIFDEYAEGGDSGALLSSLRVIAKVKGITAIARETGMTRQGVQKALSSNGNPRLDSVNSIMHALGYRLMPEKMPASFN